MDSANARHCAVRGRTIALVPSPPRHPGLRSSVGMCDCSHQVLVRWGGTGGTQGISEPGMCSSESQTPSTVDLGQSRPHLIRLPSVLSNLRDSWSSDPVWPSRHGVLKILWDLNTLSLFNSNGTAVAEVPFTEDLMSASPYGAQSVPFHHPCSTVWNTRSYLISGMTLG